jgi:hypothetical protein
MKNGTPAFCTTRMHPADITIHLRMCWHATEGMFKYGLSVDK